MFQSRFNRESHRVAIATLILVALGARAFAQHGDVEFEYSNGMIDIMFGPEGQVVEGDMPTSGPLLGFINESGFASENSEGLGIGPNDLISYNVLDALLYHDGAGFMPTAASIFGDDQPIASVVEITASTTTGDGLGGLVGQAGSTGDFHVHLSWLLSSGAVNGAYGVLLDLETNALGINNSDPFYMVFNFGLDQTIFDGALDDFATIVPAPNTLAVAVAGGILVLIRRRRRQP